MWWRPSAFSPDLFLILAGVWAQRHKGVSEQLQIDLSRPRDRKLLVGFALCALVFLLVTAFGSYQTYQYTESVQFCGAACHVPMHPEYTAYLRSPHARVACVECHVGSGAEWYVRSKLNGIHQLFDVVTNHIPTAHRDAGQEYAPGAGHLRTMPLAGKVHRQHRPHLLSLPRPTIRTRRLPCGCC